jgi:signal transduction histidine kinase/DNA-binding response OmpR family regulator/ligand-binding sensor domain-containing protein
MSVLIETLRDSKTFFCFLLLCFGSTFSKAQSPEWIPFEQLSEDQGLSSSYLYQITQDDQGFIWICSANGIFRYDGLQFQLVDMEIPEGGEIEDHIDRIIDLGDRGKVGLGEHHTLYHKANNDPSFRSLSLEDTLGLSLQFNQIEQGPDNMLWAAGPKGLFNINVEQGTSTKVFLPDSLSAIERFMYDKSRDRLWVINSNRTFCIDNFLEGDHNFHWIASHKNDVNDIELDALGGLWYAGTMTYIYHVDPNTLKEVEIPYESKQEISLTSNSNRINTLEEDGKGYMWAGSNYEGIYKIHIKTHRTERIKNIAFDDLSLASDKVISILKDRSDVMWVATWGGGLNKYNPYRSQYNTVRFIPGAQNTLTSSVVSTLYEDENGKMWVGSLKGLDLFDPNTRKIQNFPFNDSSGNENDIYAIEKDPSNEKRLLLGTKDGLYQFDKVGKSYSKWKGPKGENDKQIIDRLVYFLSTDSISQSTFAVTYFNYQIWKKANNSSSYKRILDLEDHFQVEEVLCTKDNKGNFWMTDYSGDLFVFDVSNSRIDTLKWHPTSETFPPNLAFGKVFIDQSDRVWLPTLKGLHVLTLVEGGYYKMKRYTSEDGLPDNYILSVEEDQRGDIWLSSNQGLTRIDMETNKISTLSKQDGLQANQFEYGASFFSKKNKLLYFGGVEGLNYFNIEHLQLDTTPPELAFLNFEILNEDSTRCIRLEDLSNPEQTPIELSHKDRIMTTQFVALNHTLPSSNYYAIKLEGFDRNWRNLEHVNKATFTNLSTGSYTLKIKAANKDGFWSKHPIQQRIIVHPPWWETWWAYLIYGLSFTSLIVLYFRFSLSKQEAQLEVKRIKELDHLKTRLYANITHEFRTPLTVILGVTKELERKLGKEVEKGLSVISRNGQNLLHLINQMLDLSKLDANKLELNMVQGNIVTYLENQTEAFYHLAKRKGIQLSFHKATESIDMDFDPHKIYQIFSNLLSNAIKFSRSGDEIRVSITTLKTEVNVPDRLVLKVEDTGEGIKEEDLQHIFDRFYQVDNSNKREGEGTGIGLSLVEELIALMGGEIQVSSTFQKGTQFKLILPISNLAPFVRADQEKTSYLLPNLQVGEDSFETILDDQEEKPLLLIIEDNADIRAYIQRCLSSEYAIIAAENGMIGCEKAIERIPDIILSDVMMPKKDGFEVCLELKSNIKTSHIPIVLLTARAEVEDRIVGMNRGADDYLAKPFDEEELKVVLKNLVHLRKHLQKRYSRITEEDAKAPIDQKIEDTFIVQARNILLDHLEDATFGIQELCRELAMSRMQLHRKLKALTNLSTSIFIRNIKLERAAHLLKTSDDLISEVAYKVGFNDPKYFSKVFTEQYKSSPREFRVNSTQS